MPVVGSHGHVVGVLWMPTSSRRRAANIEPAPASCNGSSIPPTPGSPGGSTRSPWRDAMSSPARTISPCDRPLAEAATLMLDESVNRLPVVDLDGTPRGARQPGDLVRAFARTDAEIQSEIQEDILRRVMWLDPSALASPSRAVIVTLTGEVATASDADLLPRFARRVPGVVEVRGVADGARRRASRLLLRRRVHVRGDVGDLLLAELAVERRHRASPFVTRSITSAVDGFASSSDGPTLPVEPAARTCGSRRNRRSRRPRPRPPRRRRSRRSAAAGLCPSSPACRRPPLRLPADE